MKNQKEFNYRKFYEKSLGIKIPNRFVIHHLDLNHYNNDIDNLLMLPRKLHEEYHRLSSKICDCQLDIKISSHMSGFRSQLYKINLLNTFMNTYTECVKWMDFKNFLLGAFPNIHNIDVTIFKVK